DKHGALPVPVPGTTPLHTFREALKATLPKAEADRLNRIPGTATTEQDIAKATGLQVHVIEPDGTFTRHGDPTGLPVHVVRTDSQLYQGITETVHIGRPGISYPGPSRTVAHGEDRLVHRGDMEIETIGGEHFVRVYTAIVNPAKFPEQPGKRVTSPFKDIQQNPVNGQLSISPGNNPQLWAGVGRPIRAMQWLAKYVVTDGATLSPRLRSFLVPLNDYQRIASGTAVEGSTGSNPATHSFNVDQRADSNQFGIGGKHLDALIEHARPGSLETYLPYSETPPPDELGGRVRPVADLYERVGLSREFRPDVLGMAYNPWLTAKSAGGIGFRNDPGELHRIASDLREHYLTWQQNRAPAGTTIPDALIQPDATQLPGGTTTPLPDQSPTTRQRRLNEFLNTVGPGKETVAAVESQVLTASWVVVREQLHKMPTTQAADAGAVLTAVRGTLLADGLNAGLAAVRVQLARNSLAEFQKMVENGPGKVNKVQVSFTDGVLEPLARAVWDGTTVKKRRFEGIGTQPDLSLLTEPSRNALAEIVLPQVKAAVQRQLTPAALRELDKIPGRGAGWLTGDRLAKFQELVLRDLRDDESDTALQIDPAKLPTDLREQLFGDNVPVPELEIGKKQLTEALGPKIISPATAEALADFREQNLLGRTAEDLRTLVRENVLDRLSAATEQAINERALMRLLEQGQRAELASTVATQVSARVTEGLKSFVFTDIDPTKVAELMGRLPELASQAEIGALLAADADRIKVDFNSRMWNPDKVAAVLADAAKSARGTGIDLVASVGLNRVAVDFDRQRWNPEQITELGKRLGAVVDTHGVGALTLDPDAITLRFPDGTPGNKVTALTQLLDNTITKSKLTGQVRADSATNQVAVEFSGPIVADTLMDNLNKAINEAKLDVRVEPRPARFRIDFDVKISDPGTVSDLKAGLAEVARQEGAGLVSTVDTTNNTIGFESRLWNQARIDGLLAKLTPLVENSGLGKVVADPAAIAVQLSRPLSDADLNRLSAQLKRTLDQRIKAEITADSANLLTVRFASPQTDPALVAQVRQDLAAASTTPDQTPTLTLRPGQFRVELNNQHTDPARIAELTETVREFAKQEGVSALLTGEGGLTLDLRSRLADERRVANLTRGVSQVIAKAEIGGLVTTTGDGRLTVAYQPRLLGTEADPFPNDYARWRAEQEQTRLTQRATGEALKALLDSDDTPEHKATALVQRLIADFHADLDHKFDEVCTKHTLKPIRTQETKDAFTFYEHAQMVLGQYLKLTTLENDGTRFVPVEALAKAILFHDIEKVNAKNQFGEGYELHDREPEHLLAVQLMQRFRGLWSSDRDFRLATAIVDSDPFGFYLRGKLSKEDTFAFIDRLAGKYGEGTPAETRKLFEEFHQYYQADFSSYTRYSSYLDRAGQQQTGPNHFSNRFATDPQDRPLFTPDGRTLQYAPPADGVPPLKQMFEDLRALFATDEAIQRQRAAQAAAETRQAPTGPPADTTGRGWPEPKVDNGSKVADDEGWRHSERGTAPWFDRADTALNRNDWAEARQNAPVRTVNTSVLDVRGDARFKAAENAPVTSGLVPHYEGLIRYDHRRIEVPDRGAVQEFTLRVHLAAEGRVTHEQVEQVKQRAQDGVRRLLDQGHRLPGGDQFAATVEFVDRPELAHTTVKVGEQGRSTQQHWSVTASDSVLAHEIAHYFGLPDEYAERSNPGQPDTARVLLRPRGDIHPSGVHQDSGLMGVRVHEDDVQLMPRHLWLINRIAQGALPVHGIEPVPAPLRTQLDRHGVDPVPVRGGTRLETFASALDTGLSTVEKGPRRLLREHAATATSEQALAEAAGLQVHVFECDGGFSTFGPPTGVPVHVLRTADGRYQGVVENVHIGRPDISYPGSSRITEGDKLAALHRSEMEVETIRGEHFVRLYTAVFKPEDFKDGPLGQQVLSDFKDIQQDPDSGMVHISSGANGGLWAGGGRPLRAVQWLAKYLEDAKQPKMQALNPQPVLRSWLVPLETYQRFTQETAVEGHTGSVLHKNTVNVDQRGDGNQFGIGGGHLGPLMATARPGSLITYLPAGQETLDQSTRAGRIRPVADLYERLGLNRNFSPDPARTPLAYNPWFAATREQDGTEVFDGFRNDPNQLHRLAADLREHYYTWLETQSGHGTRFPEALFERDATQIPGDTETSLPDLSPPAREKRLNEFLNTHGPGANMVAKVADEVLKPSAGTLPEGLTAPPEADRGRVLATVRDRVVQAVLDNGLRELDAFLRQGTPSGTVPKTDTAMAELVRRTGKPGKKPTSFEDLVLNPLSDALAFGAPVKGTDQRTGGLVNHPDLALLTEDSRIALATEIRPHLKAALQQQFQDLSTLPEPTRVQGKKQSWLYGERARAFRERVVTDARGRLDAVTLPELEVNTGSVPAVVREQVLGPVTDAALTAFRQQDLARSSADQLRELVVGEVLAELTRQTEQALDNHPVLAVLDPKFQRSLAQQVPQLARERAEAALAGFTFRQVEQTEITKLMEGLPELATQAEIGAVLAADVDRTKIDFNVPVFDPAKLERLMANLGKAISAADRGATVTLEVQRFTVRFAPELLNPAKLDGLAATLTNVARQVRPTTTAAAVVAGDTIEITFADNRFDAKTWEKTNADLRKAAGTVRMGAELNPVLGNVVVESTVTPDQLPRLTESLNQMATAAAIGARLTQENGRFTVSFDQDLLLQRPAAFPNSYAEWKANREQEWREQRATGDQLNRMLGEGSSTRDLVELLRTKYPRDLARKFDAVCTEPRTPDKGPDRTPSQPNGHTFHEHAQMVLGQYLKLTAHESHADRFVPVEAFAKAILFHDIEKNNAKNQFGDGYEVHDREPEHLLAAQLVRRFRGLWSSDRDFRLAVAVMDSDPFGFYLRGKLTADETFAFLDRLARKHGEGTAAETRKLFEEFHQYYQADFSSYTRNSSFLDADGHEHRGPNAFTNRFLPDGEQLARTPDNRHFRYSGEAGNDAKMADLTAMFATDETLLAHRNRLGSDSQPTPADLAPPDVSRPEPIALSTSDLTLVPTGEAFLLRDNHGGSWPPLDLPPTQQQTLLVATARGLTPAEIAEAAGQLPGQARIVLTQRDAAWTARQLADQLGRPVLAVNGTSDGDAVRVFDLDPEGWAPYAQLLQHVPSNTAEAPQVAAVLPPERWLAPGHGLTRVDEHTFRSGDTLVRVVPAGLVLHHAEDVSTSDDRGLWSRQAGSAGPVVTLGLAGTTPERLAEVRAVWQRLRAHLLDQPVEEREKAGLPG
ncbi:hypothetical protein M8C13_33815, partial [Crossiella sp. SN42]|nr:hypothetical protein [Crossiella sp. SN42]